MIVRTDEAKVAGSDARVQAYVLQPSTKRTPTVVPAVKCKVPTLFPHADSDGSGPNRKFDEFDPGSLT